MVMKYKTDSGPLGVVFIVKNTVVPALKKSWDFRIFLLVYVVVFICYYFGWLPLPGASAYFDLNMDFVRVITGITTFFVVFYSNNCYSRYQRMYDLTQDVFAGASCFAYMLRTQLLEKTPNHARLSIRYMVAAVWLHFLHLKGKTSDIELQKLVAVGQSPGLLRQHEAQCLLRLDSNKWGIIVLGWANEVACAGCIKAGAAKGLVKKMIGHVTQVNVSMQTISNIQALPVPYQYYHILCKMVSSNILMWAYVMGSTASFLAAFSFLAFSSVFLGMMMLSNALSDPFGDDDVDFPLEMWLYQLAEFLIAVSEKQFVDGEERMDGITTSTMYVPRLNHSLTLLTERTMPLDPLPFGEATPIRSFDAETSRSMRIVTE
mmetsp:Transcript_30858/g.81131  ORF Transcript_30858/g.81131 Transcript_30858/m.81131 type:complete len:375 (+) Transcript_30858:75-1199(+)